MTPPFSLQRHEYWAPPTAIFDTSFDSISCRKASAPGPSTSTSPMCETSNIPAWVRTARVLLFDPLVEDRHLPARERHQFGAELDVLLEEWGAAEGGVVHAAQRTYPPPTL